MKLNHIFFVMLLVAILLFVGCIQSCPQSCDDSNICTNDLCGKDTNYKCQNTAIIPCCGNQRCEGGEDFFSCSSDCEYRLKPVSAIHAIVPSGVQVVNTKNVIANIIDRENNYVDSNTYIHIPGDDPTNVNSHDYVNISFVIPSNVFSKISDKSLFLNAYIACGNYGEIFIYEQNRFGGFDQLERIKCEGENWEERHIEKKLSIPPSESFILQLKRDGGNGQVKVDFIEAYIKS